MKLLPLLIVCCCIIKGYTQSPSYVDYYYNGVLESEYVIDLVQKNDSLLLISTVNAIGDDNTSFMRLRHLDISSGNIIASPYYYPVSSIELSLRRSILKDENMFFTGELYHTLVDVEHGYHITKADIYGEIEWVAIGGDSIRRTRLVDLRIDEEGNFYGVGFVSNTPVSFIKTLLVCKYDNTGELIWSTEMSAIYAETAGKSIVIGENGYIYAMGNDRSSFSGNYEMVIHKLTPDGDLVWSQYYNFGGNVCHPYEMQLAHNGNLIVLGLVKNFNSSGIRPALVEIDRSGDINWISQFNEEVENLSGFGEYFCKTLDGGYAWAFESIEANGVDSRLFLVVKDENGETIDVQNFVGYSLESPRDIIQLEDSSFVITGLMPPDFIPDNDPVPVFWLLKTDVNGELTSISYTGIEMESIKVFPNPTRGIVNVEMEYLGIIKLSVVDILGNVHYSKTKNLNGISELDLSKLSDGVYFIHFYDKNGRIGVKKIIKKGY